MAKAEVFTKECRLTPADFDIMGLRQGYMKEKVEGLVKDFPSWYSNRLPGSRAIHSTYDRFAVYYKSASEAYNFYNRVAVTICKWLYQSLHDVHAASVFDYIVLLLVGHHFILRMCVA